VRKRRKAGKRAHEGSAQNAGAGDLEHCHLSCAGGFGPWPPGDLQREVRPAAPFRTKRWKSNRPPLSV
jgi:hypothetical protein